MPRRFPYQFIDFNLPLVDPETGRVTPYFQRQLFGQVENAEDVSDEVGTFAAAIAALQTDKADKAITLTAGTGLDGGGDLSADRTFELEPLTPDPSGSFTNTNLTVDAFGRVTEAANGSGGGGGGGGGYFSGIGLTGILTDTSARASKGTVFRPDRDITVSHIRAIVDSAATADTYRAEIWTVTGVTFTGSGEINGLTTVAMVGDAPTPVSANSTIERVVRMELTTPATLTAGVDYLVVIVLASAALGTTACRVTRGSPFSDAFYPGTRSSSVLYFNTIGLSASQASDAAGVIVFIHIWLEGTF